MDLFYVESRTAKARCEGKRSVGGMERGWGKGVFLLFRVGSLPLFCHHNYYSIVRGRYYSGWQPSCLPPHIPLFPQAAPPARVREQRRMAGRRLLVGSTRHFFVRSHLSLLRSSVPVESGAPLSLSLSLLFAAACPENWPRSSITI